MSTSAVEGLPLESSPYKATPWVYFVRECSFTFQFVTLDQLKECLEWFEKKIHPSSREYNNGLEHYWQRWYERLPKGLTRESKRIKIAKALKKAYEEFNNN